MPHERGGAVVQYAEQYKVIGNTPEAPGVATLTLARAKDGSIPEFAAGQFITVYFPETGTPEGKAYSISSAPGESPFSITVRGIGEFSNRLCALRAGDTIAASLPYGYFSSADEKNDLVLLAAGIGIAPYRSIIRDALKKNPTRKIALFYTSRNSADIIFKKEFDTLQGSNKNFTVHYFITRESAALAGITNRRMCAEDILNNLNKEHGAEFLICGAIPFVRDLWQGLKAGGVSEDAIYTEAFFS